MVRPRQLVQAAAEAGLSVVAVTDHDTFAGWAEAVEAGAEFGVEVVTGEEVTTRSPANVHVVGLFLAGPVRMGMEVTDTIAAIHDQGGLAVLALAEEDQLEAVTMAVAGADVAGVIPPLGAILRVIEMVARKLVRVTGQRDFVVEYRGQKPECEGQRPAYRTQLYFTQLGS